MKEKNVKVCIVGGGKVGTSLARQLAGTGCEVTVIDTDLNVVNKISNSLDVICYQGNGAAKAILLDADAGAMDIFIAVTGSDELNILSCLTAHSMGAKSTIARVRNADYATESEFYMEKFGLSMTINPDFAAAREIHRLIHFPQATKVELFAKGRCEMIEMKVEEGNTMIGNSLMQINQYLRMNILICAIVRDDRVIAPNGNVVIKEGDYIYFTGTPVDVNDAFKKMNLPVRKIRSVILAGGSRIAYYLSRLLLKDGVKVTIVEKVHSNGVMLADLLPGAQVMTEDAIEYFDTMSDTDIKNTDAIVALTNNDEYNLISSMYALKKKIYKVITKMNSHSSVREMAKGYKVSTVSKEDVAADIILRYVRSVMAAERYDSIESLYRIMDGKIEFLEFKINEEDKFTGISIKNLKIIDGFKIACINRNRQIIVPRGDDTIKVGDTVLVCCIGKQISRIHDIFN